MKHAELYSALTLCYVRMMIIIMLNLKLMFLSLCISNVEKKFFYLAFLSHKGKKNSFWIHSMSEYKIYSDFIWCAFKILAITVDSNNRSIIFGFYKTVSTFKIFRLGSSLHVLWDIEIEIYFYCFSAYQLLLDFV